MRAGSKIHVEYEVLKHLMDKIDLSELEEKMVHQYKGDDKYDRLVKRWEDGSGEIGFRNPQGVAKSKSFVNILLYYEK